MDFQKFEVLSKFTVFSIEGVEKYYEGPEQNLSISINFQNKR